MTRAPRVLVLTSTFPRWEGDATPRFVADLSEGLAREGLDVTVLAPGSHGAARAERLGHVDVRRFQYSWPARTQWLADGAILPNIRANRLLALQAPPFVLAQLAAAWRLARNGQFDVIHAHWVVPQGLTAAALKRATGIPVVTTTHGTDVFALRARPFAEVKRRVLAASDAVTAVSAPLRRAVVQLGVPEDRVHVLPMGVNTTRFSPDAVSGELRAALNPRGGPIILFVGRIVEQKGIMLAIQAMPLILRARPDARLVIVGDGPDGTRARALSARLNLGHAVVFTGSLEQDELARYYATADLLVAPSMIAPEGDTEAFGLVIAEAMASGCPVVSTATGGIPDLISDGDTGLLIRSLDSAGLAGAVVQLLEQHEFRCRMGEAARASVQARFNAAAAHAAYARLISECLVA